METNYEALANEWNLHRRIHADALNKELLAVGEALRLKKHRLALESGPDITALVARLTARATLDGHSIPESSGNLLTDAQRLIQLLGKVDGAARYKQSDRVRAQSNPEIVPAGKYKVGHRPWSCHGRIFGPGQEFDASEVQSGALINGIKGRKVFRVLPEVSATA